MENGSGNQGSGWTDGDVPTMLYPQTREGRVKLYTKQRRWINATSSWTRIGSGSAIDARHSTSGSGDKIVEDEASTVKALIAQLCERFYQLGWATGTAGGVSIRILENEKWRVFGAPSGIQKEDMIGDDVFELDMDQNIVEAPKTPNLELSASTPLWFCIYRNRPSAKCVIHTHSIYSMLATLLDSTEQSSVLSLTHLEMIKGVGNHAYDDMLEIPIIDNRPSEDLLEEQLENAIRNYPKCNAVLVRRHGLYVWGDSWEQAKTQCESFDYLFQAAVEMHKMGLHPAKVPTSGTFRVENCNEPDAKRPRLEPAFNGVSGKDNEEDLKLGKLGNLPMVPRDGKILLLDIEGCTTSISFVKDTLFPYVLAHLKSYLNKCDQPALEVTWSSLKQDILKFADDGLKSELDLSTKPPDVASLVSCIEQIVTKMVQRDIKATGLKQLQGQMWKAGYESGEIKAHVYPDFVPFLKWCQSQNVAIHIYSSGSIQAQKLLFGHTTEGNLLGYLSRYFDTTSGGKKVSESYQNIVKSLGISPSQLIFVSDAEAELVAARQAGVQTVMSIRPGNAPLTKVGKQFPAVFSLLQLCGV